MARGERNQRLRKRLARWERYQRLQKRRARWERNQRLRTRLARCAQLLECHLPLALLEQDPSDEPRAEMWLRGNN